MKTGKKSLNLIPMEAQIQYNKKDYTIDLNDPLDISIEMNSSSVRAWYQDNISINPVVDEGFIGEVKSGAPVNFRNILFNPHAHGTHTECYGHISEEWVSVSEEISSFFHLTKLITVNPIKQNEDLVITKELLEELIDLENEGVKALVIRTSPNDSSKLTKNYSNSNPPYISAKAMQYIVDLGIDHLMIDLPSVDKENDEGKLEAHRIFWNYPENIRKHASITEMVYIPDTINDGYYFSQIQFPKFNNDASPSRVFLFSLQ